MRRATAGLSSYPDANAGTQRRAPATPPPRGTATPQAMLKRAGGSARHRARHALGDGRDSRDAKGRAGANRVCPEAAVPAVPARPLLLCLLLGSSWLTVEGDRHGSAGVPHRRGGRAALAGSVSVGWWRANWQLSPPRRQTSEFSRGCGGLAPPARRLVLVHSRTLESAPQDAHIPAEASAARACRDAPRRAANYGRASTPGLDVGDRLADVPGAPCLVSCRTEDAWLSPDNGRYLAEQIPGRSCSSFPESTTIGASGRPTTSSRRWRSSSPRSGATGPSGRCPPSPDRSVRFSKVAAGSWA